jgi:hypothetical protein
MALRRGFEAAAKAQAEQGSPARIVSRTPTGDEAKCILDWEAGALYWNCLESAAGDDAAALAKVRGKDFG